MGTEDVVYTTGYQSNLGCISAILEPRDTVICDSGDHASILDGCKLSGARLRPFRHIRMDKLETMLERAAADQSGTFVVVDGVFSMEGDVCDLPRSWSSAGGSERLMVDEAHGVECSESAAPAPASLRARGAGRSAAGGTFSKSPPPAVSACRRRGGDRVPEDRLALLHLQRLGGPGGRGRCARRPADHPLRGPELMSCWGTPPTYARGSATSVFGWWSPGPPTEATTPVVPVIVGEDWQVVLL